jgi:hypothetical protein
MANVAECRFNKKSEAQREVLEHLENGVKMTREAWTSNTIYSGLKGLFGNSFVECAYKIFM